MTATSHTISIPETMRTFAREVSALCRKHGVREFSGSFKPPHDTAWGTSIEFSWAAGRHGATGYEIVLTSTHTEYVRDVLTDEKEVAP